jgi:hypothetical protein
MTRLVSRLLAAVAIITMFILTANGQDTDAAYVARFLERFPKVESPPPINDYATTARFDERFMGEAIDKALENVGKGQGNNAWGLAYWMHAYNEMYRVTKDPKYLAANLRYTEAMLAARDDKQGLVLWTGAIAPAWSSDKYAERGRAVFAVHTGMIVYPMLDLLLLLREAPEVLAPDSERYQDIQRQALETTAYHDRQWRDGPGEGEGHYVGVDQEDILEGKVLPGNRLSAMGRVLWTAWKLTGDESYRDRAIALGHYIKNRLGVGSDGAYYWEYWLSEEPVTGTVEREAVNGEDTSHGQLTASFPFMLAADGEVFDETDMQRFAMTVLNGVARRDDGILLGNVTGNPDSNVAHVASPEGWFPPSVVQPEVKDRLVAFYLNYLPSPGPLDLAVLLRYTGESP